MTTLYIKTHNITGLKYFGKTNRNPHEYKGSGTYWKRHIKIHGDDITTEIYAQIDEITETELLTNTAISFSIDNNIVKSTEWANLMIEDGLSGGNTYKNKSEKEMNIIKNKLKISQSGKNNGMYGKKHSKSTIEKNKKAHIGKKASLETKNKMSETRKRIYRETQERITVFDNNGVVVFVCKSLIAEFKKECEKYNLPTYKLQESMWNGGIPIYKNLRNCDVARLKKSNRLQFVGYYAIKS